MGKFLCFMLFTTIVVAGLQADPVVNVTFDNPNQTGLAGDTLQFFGTIVNPDPDNTVFLNEDEINGLPLDGNFTVNDLFANVPFSLGPSASSGDIELFDVTLTNPFTDPLGVYPGSYALLGGADGNTYLTLATVNFSVDAVSVPEPATILLVGAGLLGLVRRVRRSTV